MVLYIDGGCSGNGQRDMALRKMVAVVTDEAGAVLSEQDHEGGSNNIAELIAARDAMVRVLGCQVDGQSVQIRTDSRNTLSWAMGTRGTGKGVNDRARVDALRTEIVKARSVLAVRGTKLSMVWVPRELNLAGHYIERKYAL